MIPLPVMIWRESGTYPVTTSDVVLILVTRPLALTVMTGTEPPAPYVPAATPVVSNCVSPMPPLATAIVMSCDSVPPPVSPVPALMARLGGTVRF
jgi:hypothetical protein